MRGRGEGSIYRRKDGRWVGAISLGKGKRKSFYGRTRKEVAAKMNAAIAERQAGTFVASNTTTVGDFLDHWLEEIHRPELRASSYRSYRYTLDVRLIPAFGGYPLQKLTPQIVETQYAAWRAEGISTTSISKWHGILHKALDKAMQWELIGRNVCDLARPGRIVKTEKRTLSEHEAQRLFVAARAYGMETLLLLAVVTGMRKGELLGLRWTDVDLMRKELHITRTAAHIAGAGIVENEPKTAKGRRTLLLADIAIEALRVHKAAQAGKPNAGNRVFPDARGKMWDTSQLHRAWKTVLQEAGLPDIPFHNLRHSAATILLAQGVEMHVVRDILGHSSIRMTVDLYGGTLPPSAQAGAAKAWDSLLKRDKD